MFHHSRRFFDVMSCNNFVLALLSPVLSHSSFSSLSYPVYILAKRHISKCSSFLFSFPFFSRRSIFISSHSLSLLRHSKRTRTAFPLALSLSFWSFPPLQFSLSFTFFRHSNIRYSYGRAHAIRWVLSYLFIYLFIYLFFSLELLDKRCFPFYPLFKFSLLSSLIRRAMITQSGLAFQLTTTVYQIFTQQGQHNYEPREWARPNTLEIYYLINRVEKE